MAHNDRIDVCLGFSHEDAVRFREELLKQDELIFLPQQYSPKHIAVDEASRMPAYHYVNCRMLMSTIISLAGSGMRGESPDSIAAIPPMIRLNTKEVFEDNCRRETSEMDGRLPNDAEYMLAQLLSLGNVHIMSAPVIQYGDRTIEARTSMYGSNEEFIRSVKERLASEHQVFIYNYKVRETNGSYCSYISYLWRWNSIPKD
jgi:hypothetical protein